MDFGRFMEERKVATIRKAQGSQPHAREFQTFHSFYVHDKTNDPHRIISAKLPGYNTLPQTHSEDRRALESESDCEVPAGAG